MNTAKINMLKKLIQDLHMADGSEESSEQPKGIEVAKVKVLTDKEDGESIFDKLKDSPMVGEEESEGPDESLVGMFREMMKKEKDEGLC